MMDIKEAIAARHSVREYKDDPIAEDVRAKLDEFALQCGKEGGIDIKIIYDDPSGFDSGLAHYGGFKNVKNYIVLSGKPGADFDYRCGYYGEKLVLFAQQLGLNTCWVALTFNKKKVKEIVPQGESLCMVISLGYGTTQGSAHKGKTLKDVMKGDGPDWFKEGVEAALLAPTAMNQQKFIFSYEDQAPCIKVRGLGPYTKVDCGIAAYHFEAVTGRSLNRD